MSDRRTLETGTEDLLAHVEDRVAVLTMNRPARRNALSGAMLMAMDAVLADFETDNTIRIGANFQSAQGSQCWVGNIDDVAMGIDQRHRCFRTRAQGFVLGSTELEVAITPHFVGAQRFVQCVLHARQNVITQRKRSMQAVLELFIQRKQPCFDLHPGNCTKRAPLVA